MPLQLVAISYPDESTADRAATELARCADELTIDPDCAAVIVCERDGCIRLITSRRPGGSSHWLGFWGGLLGRLTDCALPGFEPELRRRLDASLSPGTSVLLVLLPGGRRARTTEALSPLGGSAIGCTLSEEQVAYVSERRRASASLQRSPDQGDERKTTMVQPRLSLVSRTEDGGLNMSEDGEELGPIDYILVEWSGQQPNGEVAPHLVDLVDRGLIRVLDLVFMRKQESGEVEIVEISDLGQADETLLVFEGAATGLLDQEDLDEAGAVLAPGTAAALLVFENRWAAPFATAVRKSGGELVASGRIPVNALISALDAVEAGD